MPENFENIDTLTQAEMRDIRKKIAFEDISARVLSSFVVATYSYGIGNFMYAVSNSKEDLLYNLGFVACGITYFATLGSILEDIYPEQRMKKQRELGEIAQLELSKYIKQFDDE